MFTQEQLYLNIQANFGEVFEWIEEEVSGLKRLTVDSKR